MRLPAAELAFVDLLVCRARLATLELSALFWGDSSTTGRRKCADGGSTGSSSVGSCVHYGCLRVPLIDLAKPLVVWEPGDSLPEFERAAWRLARRWKAACRETVVYVATPRGAGAVRRTRPRRIKSAGQVTHDLHVTLLYLQFLTCNPQSAARWVGEDAIPVKPGVKVPDALLVDDAGHPLRAIEFGGSYPARRLARPFHAHCAA